MLLVVLFVAGRRALLGRSRSGRRCDGADWLETIGTPGRRLALRRGVPLPLMPTDRYLLKVLTFVGLNVLVVTGLALLFGYAGQISLGHAAFVGIGAYTPPT